MQQRWLRAAVMAGALAVLGLTAAMPALAQSSVAWLGVYTQTLNADLRAGLDYDGDGVVVSGVVDDSPADRAGVRKGDIIVSFNSRRVETSAALTELVRDARVGQEVTLAIWRDGERRTLTPRLGTRPSGDAAPRTWTPREDGEDEDGRMEFWVAPDAPDAPEAPKAPRAPKAPSAPKAPRAWVFEDENGERHELHLRGLERLRDLQGLEKLGRLRELENLPEIMARAGRPRLGIMMEDTDAGVRVTDVLEDTPAERAGLREGDVIRRVNGVRIGDTDDLSRAVREAGEGPVSVEVRRNGTTRTLEAKLGPKRERVVIRGRASGPTPRTFEFHGRGPGADADLRQELQELRREVEALRRELREREDDR